MKKQAKAGNVRGIYLVGFSGSGKTAVAKLVGEILGWPSCDIDDVIVEHSGLTIPLIFQQQGETGFRVLETEALRDASSSDRASLSRPEEAPLRGLSTGFSWPARVGLFVWRRNPRPSSREFKIS
ncbi:MAG: hypothetical protein DMG14_20450 [Acidobacteria bacterium]|nr:MAG: hypothetical protein DMG14_20450 [Acidobacteriota bacterium]